MTKTEGVESSVRPSRQESRSRLLDVLRQAGQPLGITALTQRTGLSAGAVRFHLANLLRAGSARRVKPATHDRPGRPVVEYEALAVDAGDPAQAYRMLAAMLGRQLSHAGQPRAAYEAGRQWSQQTVPATAGGASAPTPRDVVQQLFREGGFEPFAREDGRTVELRRCPFYDLAAEMPGVVCAVHEGLTVGALESAGLPATVRVVPVLDASGPCLVHLNEPPQSSDVSVPSASTKEIVP